MAEPARVRRGTISTGRPAAVMMLAPGWTCASASTALVEADGLEDPQHLVVDDRRSRQQVGLGLAVERQGAHAAVAEQQCQQLADRARGRR